MNLTYNRKTIPSGYFKMSLVKKGYSVKWCCSGSVYGVFLAGVIWPPSVLVLVSVLVFEHVTQQLLHGCAANGPVKEQLLYFLRAHEVEGRQQK